MSFKRVFQAVETCSGEPMRVVTGTDSFVDGYAVGDIRA